MTPAGPAPTVEPLFDFSPTLPHLIAHSVAHHGDRDFLVGPDFHFTYADMEALSRRYALHLLARGVGKGTRLGLMFPNSPDGVALFLAAGRIGAFVMPFSTLFKPAELRSTLRLSDTSHLVVPARLFGQDHLAFVESAVPGLADQPAPPLFLEAVPFLRRVHTVGPSDRGWAEPLDPDAPTGGPDDELLAAVEREVTPADWLVTIWTSGTTSDPKGVVHSHGSEVRHAARLADMFGVGPDERILAGLPFFWVGGLNLTLLAALHTGPTLLCLERLDPEPVLDLAERLPPTRATIWSRRARGRIVLHPTFAARPPEATAAFRRMRDAPHGGRTMPNSLGMSETSGPHTGVPALEMAEPLPEHLYGSFGRPLPGVAHRIADPLTGDTLPEGVEGEICVRGYSLLQGLYKYEREATFDEEGWFHTGDLGYFKEGHLFFTGRRGDMIKSSGSNVAPLEVEAVLASIPVVKAAYVFGVPDRLVGEAVVAVVVADDPDDLDVAGLLGSAKERLSSYKVPREVVTLGEEDVPYLPSGKADVRALRRIVGERLGPPGDQTPG